MGQSHPQALGDLGVDFIPHCYTDNLESGCSNHRMMYYYTENLESVGSTRDSPYFAELNVASYRAGGSDGAVAPPGLWRLRSRTTFAVLPAHRDVTFLLV